MSVTINGSGTVTGITPGGLPDGVITTDDIAANAVTTPKLGTDEASGLAKAWVNFNGTGTVAIRAQYNVSSITDNGTGNYTVNFTTAMPDANYSTLCNGRFTAGGSVWFAGFTGNATYQGVSGVNVNSLTSSGSSVDALFFQVAIFR